MKFLNVSKNSKTMLQLNLSKLESPEKVVCCASTTGPVNAIKFQVCEEVLEEEKSLSRLSSPERAVKKAEDPFAQNELLADIFPDNNLVHKISPEHEVLENRNTTELGVMTCSTPLMECMPYDESDLSIPMNLLEDDSIQGTFESK